MKVNTSKLLAMLSTVTKGVGSKYSLPITEYLLFEVSEESGLVITATDGQNFISFFDRSVKGEEASAVIKADTIYKLVQKTTKDTMTFNFLDGHVEVKGNGSYKVESLSPSDFPTYEFDHASQKIIADTKVLKAAINKNESAIARENIVPYLAGFYLSDKVITTDGIKMCINDVNVLNHPLLLSQDLSDLLMTITDESATFQRDGNKILVKTGNLIIFGAELDGINDYPDITPILGVPYESSATVYREPMLKTLDRLSLFVDTYDNDGVRVKFSGNEITLEDLKKNSQESIELVESNFKEEFEVVLNINFLVDLLKAMEELTVKIHFGEGLPLKMEEEKTTFVLGTMAVEE